MSPVTLLIFSWLVRLLHQGGVCDYPERLEEECVFPQGVRHGDDCEIAYSMSGVSTLALSSHEGHESISCRRRACDT